jgi:hypothetical protein
MTRDEFLQFLHLLTLTRAEFLRLLMLKSTTLGQRVFNGELAFAYGLSHPVEVGKYSALDALSAMAVSMLHACAKIPAKAAADLMRKHWEAFLKAVAKVERQMAAGHTTWTASEDEIWFAVATAFGDDGKVRRVLGAIGTRQETAGARRNAGSHASIYMMPLKLPLRTLRNNERDTGVELPKLLVAG